MKKLGLDRRKDMSSMMKGGNGGGWMKTKISLLTW